MILSWRMTNLWERLSSLHTNKFRKDVNLFHPMLYSIDRYLDNRSCYWYATSVEEERKYKLFSHNYVNCHDTSSWNLLLSLSVLTGFNSYITQSWQMFLDLGSHVVSGLGCKNIIERLLKRHSLFVDYCRHLLISLLISALYLKEFVMFIEILIGCLLLLFLPVYWLLYLWVEQMSFLFLFFFSWLVSLLAKKSPEVCHLNCTDFCLLQ